MVVRDSYSECLFAHTIAQKGVDENRLAVEAVVEDIVWLGHARVLVRSDNEPAIAKLVQEALKTLKVEEFDQAASEGAVPFDPMSNGAAEAAVEIMKGMARTLQMGWKGKCRCAFRPTIR